MARTENVTRYVCDRCGEEAYLPENAAAAGDWRDVQRFDQYGSRVERLLCKACTDAYKRLAASQDASFQRFMAGKEA